MASSLSGLSSIGVLNGFAFPWSTSAKEAGVDCAAGDVWDGTSCNPMGYGTNKCGPDEFLDKTEIPWACVKKPSAASAAGPCSADQVYIYDDAGNPACVSQAEWEKIKAKRQSTGGSTKSVTPITPGVTVEDGVDWKPLAAMAVLAAAVVTIIVRKRNRGMTSNSHGYDEDC